MVGAITTYHRVMLLTIKTKELGNSIHSFGDFAASIAWEKPTETGIENV